MTDGGDLIGAPEPLTAEHDLTGFDSGETALDDWLRKRALTNEQSGASRTYVVVAGGRVVGFYCLAAGSVTKHAATGHIRRNMPEPIPVMIIGRLAIDRAFQRRGLGKALLRDAVLRTLQAAAIAGIARFFCAISEARSSFALRLRISGSLTMMISVAEPSESCQASNHEGTFKTADSSGSGSVRLRRRRKNR